jgi:WD40 repeat protein/serine/threonine protein kinase
MAEVTVAWRIGEVIDGRYEVTALHEHGGMGLVYRVRHLAWDIDLAVKSPRPDRFGSPEDRQRFIAEAETWVSLGLHPHVCNCYYVRVLDGVPRVFAEYVPGGSLHEWISDRRLYAGDPTEVLARILDVAVQTAWGLDHAHSHGLVHRDVKPANVLLDTEDTEERSVTAKVTDFGMAGARDLAATVSPDAPPGVSILVPAGDGLTPLYASPEQAAGEPVGRRTDIYSFAVSVLETCAGEVTWMTGPAAGAALTGYRGDDAAGAVAIPPALGDLLERCLRPNPADRPASMADVATELVDVYRGVTGHAYPRPAPATAELLSDGLNNRALSLIDLDRPAEADQAFSQALAADPHNVRAVYNAGLARWRCGGVTDDALIAEIEATRADTGDPWEARYVLAQIHLERGDLITARTLLDEVAAQRPEEPEVLAALRGMRSGRIVGLGRAGEWPVPWPQRPPAPLPFDEHKERVALALTPDGRFLVSGGWDGAVRLWDVRSGQCVRTLKGHRRPVHAVDLTPDGRFAVSVCEDETVRFWELTRSRFWGTSQGRRLYASPNPPSWAGDGGSRIGVTAVRLTPDGRFALYTGLDGVFRIWDTHSGQERTLDDTATDRLVEVSADGRQALSVGWERPGGSRTRVVRLWDLADGRRRLELPGHESAVTALCLSADGRFAATDCHGGTLRVWDLADGRRVHTLTGGITAQTLAFGADGRFLLSGGSYSEAIRVWELDSGRCLRTFRAHRGGATVVRLDAHAQYGLSVGQDRTVRRWELPAGYRGAPLLSRPRPQVELSRLAGRVDALIAGAEQAMAAGRFPAALERLRQARAVTGYEREPRVMSAWWALGRRSVRTGLRAAWSSRVWHTGELTAVDLTADGRLGASGGRDGTVRLWDLDGGNRLRVLEGHEDMVESVRLSADGRSVLSSSRDATVRLWEVETGACRRVLTVKAAGSLGQSSPVRFSVDGRQAVVGGWDGRIRYWDLETGAPTRELANTGWGIDDMCVGDDGRLVVTASGGVAAVWSPADTQPVHRLRGVKRGVLAGSIRTVSLSADGRFALAGDDNGIQLWNPTTGDVLRTFDAPSDGFHAVRMTADARFAVSGHYWSYTTVWDIHNGQTIRVLDGHERGASCLALTPDGRFLLTGKDGTLRLWQLDWELAAHGAADWDIGAAPYLEAFLRRHGPSWTDRDLDALLRRLEDAGYGWLRADGVPARLERVAA